MNKSLIAAERLKQCRLNAKETLEHIAQLTGVNKSTVLRWERGETDRIKITTISALATHYNVSPAWLLGADVPMEIESEIPVVENIIPMPKMVKVPLLGTIACGEPILAEENIESYVNMPENVHGTFALKCKGDSMINARIFNGDIVYIRQQPTVENGEIAAVLIDNEATLKKVYQYPNRLELRAENPTFAPLEYEGEAMNNIRILGKAVYFVSKIR